MRVLLALVIAVGGVSFSGRQSATLDELARRSVSQIVGRRSRASFPSRGSRRMCK
jgi:hypothetical protein